MRTKRKAKTEDKPLPPYTPPKERKEIPGEFAANMRWLQTNWKEYDERWVALINGELVISGDTFKDIEPYLLSHPSYPNILWVHVGHDYRIIE